MPGSVTPWRRATAAARLACALRLAEREQLRLPLMLERGWLEPVVRRDPRLADTHRRLLAPIFGYDQVPAPAAPRG